MFRFHRIYSIFKPNIIKRVKKYDEVLDQQFPSLRAYLYFTLTQTTLFTIGGFIFGGLLGARDFIRKVENQTLSRASQQAEANDVEHALIHGRAATRKEIKSSNLIFCSLFSSYDAAAACFKVGSAPIRYPLQYVLPPLLKKVWENIDKQPSL